MLKGRGAGARQARRPQAGCYTLQINLHQTATHCTATPHHAAGNAVEETKEAWTHYRATGCPTHLLLLGGPRPSTSLDSPGAPPLLTLRAEQGSRATRGGGGSSASAAVARGGGGSSASAAVASQCLSAAVPRASCGTSLEKFVHSKLLVYAGRPCPAVCMASRSPQL